MEQMKTIETATGRYTFQPGRDMAAQLAKADKVRRRRPARRPDPAIGPAWGTGSILGRTVDYIRRRLETETGPVTVSLFKAKESGRGMAAEFNKEIEAMAKSGAVGGRLIIRYVDAADWGMSK